MNENKKKIAFIINPISGTQSKEQILKWLDEKLDKERYAQEVIYTERAGHAVEIAAQKAQEDAHAVIAIGGDGTINEIARSLVHTKTALGIIPCGLSFPPWRIAGLQMRRIPRRRCRRKAHR